jgi:hypothetical protein
MTEAATFLGGRVAVLTGDITERNVDATVKRIELVFFSLADTTLFVRHQQFS